MTVAVVTGASQGIGRAIALRLASDGMDVVVNDLEVQQAQLEGVKAEVEKLGRRAEAIVADVTSESDVERLILSVVGYFGELNVFIANAGIISVNGVLTESVEGWDRVLEVNCKSVFLCYQKAAKQMIAQGTGGKLVAACSNSAYQPAVDALAYSVSKWGIRGLTQCCALDLAKYNINVNAYCPGPVPTNMYEKLDDVRGVSKGLPKWDTFNHAVQTRAALKKGSTPEDIASAVSFLAGSQSDMMTGQSIIVDGGICFS